MNKTKIEWVKNPDGTQGYTWNPITGCLNHDNGLCKGGGFPCYAYKLAHGRLKQRYLANQEVAPLEYVGEHENYGFIEFEPAEIIDHDALSDPFYPRFWAENGPSCRLYDPTFRQKPAGIFVCDMGELFGDWVPIGWQEDVFEIIKYSPQHRFYLLTKQPQNLPKFSPFPDNCWVGVTATNNRGILGLQHLAHIEARIKFVSFEPLLEQLYLYDGDVLRSCGINWLIIGAQTKPYKPPKIEWVEEILDAAGKAGIPVFLKNNLKSLLGIPPLLDDVLLRQEMPNK